MTLSPNLPSTDTALPSLPSSVAQGGEPCAGTPGAAGAFESFLCPGAGVMPGGVVGTGAPTPSVATPVDGTAATPVTTVPSLPVLPGLLVRAPAASVSPESPDLQAASQAGTATPSRAGSSTSAALLAVATSYVRSDGTSALSAAAGRCETATASPTDLLEPSQDPSQETGQGDETLLSAGEGTGTAVGTDLSSEAGGPFAGAAVMPATRTVLPLRAAAVQTPMAAAGTTVENSAPQGKKAPSRTVDDAAGTDDDGLSEGADKTSDANPAPAAAAPGVLVYQYVAGQWIPQAPAEVVTETASTDGAMAPAAALPGAAEAVAPAPAGTDRSWTPALATMAAPQTQTATFPQASATPAAARQESRFAAVVARTTKAATTRSGVAMAAPDASSAETPAANVAAPSVVPAAAFGITKADTRFPASEPVEAAKTAAQGHVSDPAVTFPAGETRTAATPLPDGTQAAASTDAFAGGSSAPIAADQTPAQDTSAGPEKIAASRHSTRGDRASGVLSSSDVGEKKTVIADNKKVNTYTRNIGTDVANRDVSTMPPAAEKTPLTDAALPVHTPAASGIQAATTKTQAALPAEATQASRLVHEIRDIADRISAVDRNSVEVRFDFNDSERLSVRVEYKDGVVHTTFSTDSSQVRDAISHEWAAQPAAPADRGYRLADPVFSSGDLSQQAGGRGDSSGQQRSQGQTSGFAGQSLFPTGRQTTSGSSSGAAVSARPAVRPETSRHLHTFA